MALTGGGLRDARIINVAIDDLDTTKTKPDGTDAYKIKITKAFEYLYSNFLNLNKFEKERLAGLLNIKVENLTQPHLSKVNSQVFVRTKISSLLPPPQVARATEQVMPPPPPPTEGLAAVAVESAQPNVDINSRIRTLVGDSAPHIDDFTPGPDVPTETIIAAINQRIDAAQVVHDKYPAPTQSQALALETTVRDSPVVGKRAFTAKSVVGGKRKRNRKIGTKKKKHKRK